MARAFVCLARNDLDDNLLHIGDLYPNTSLRTSFQPPGQSGYITHYPQKDTVASTDGVMDADTYGLAAYLKDHVENVGGGNIALTDVEANHIATEILSKVAAGLDLTLAEINTLINLENDVSASDLDGTVNNSDSTGSVEDILRILSGEVYKVEKDAVVAGVGGAFVVAKGYFVAPPPVETVQSVRAPSGGPVRGRPFSQPYFDRVVVSGQQDLTYRPIRKLAEGGSLNNSALYGKLSKLQSEDFTFINPKFTYGNGTAKQVDGTSIPLTGKARAISVYDSNGNVLR